VVGLARLSPRSLAAVCAFMGSAIVTAGLFRAPLSAGRPAAAWALEPGYYVLVLVCVCAALAPLALVIRRAAAAAAAAAALAKAPGGGDASPAAAAAAAPPPPPAAASQGWWAWARSKCAPQLVACLCGLAFGLGLGLSGMTDPTKVLRFLDFLGDRGWDPQLMLVMGGAVFVNLFTWRAMAVGALKDVVPRFREDAAAAKSLGDIINYGPACAANKRALDARLLCGAVCFGVGWGLCGVCPGPGLVDYTTGRAHFGVAVPAMLLGGAVFEAGAALRAWPRPALAAAL
jgi:uncharacterized membrane protein YedE/YeeE